MRILKPVHLHTYKAVFGSHSFRCIKDRCTHLISAKLLPGRLAECPFCQGEFIITPEHLRRKIVHCMKCTHKGKPIKKQLEIGKIKVTNDVFAEFLKGDL